MPFLLCCYESLATITIAENRHMYMEGQSVILYSFNGTKQLFTPGFYLFDKVYHL